MENLIADSQRPLVDGLFTSSSPSGDVTLVISHCHACGAESFPARTVRCAACSSPELEPAESSMVGTLYSWTVTPMGGVPDSAQPLVVGMVNLASGLSVQGIVTNDAEELTIDAPMVGCIVDHGTDEEGVTLTGYGFRLADGEEQVQ